MNRTLLQAVLAASLTLSASAQIHDLSGTCAEPSLRSGEQIERFTGRGNNPPLVVRDFAARVRDTASIELELRAKHEIALREQRDPKLPNTLVLTPLESFSQWMNASVAYGQAYFSYTQQQTKDLADASDATFAEGEVARTSVAELLGGEYTSVSSPFSCSPVGMSYPTLTMHPGHSGPLSGVALFPWTFPQVDLSGQPAFIQSALAGVNQPTNDAFFYSAQSNGSMWHTGVAAPLAISGESAPLLVLFPTTLVGPERVLSAAEFALLRQLDVALGGLDWALLQTLIRPSFQPAAWNYSPGTDGAARQGGCATAWECLVEASHRYRNAQIAAHAAYLAELDLARQDYEMDQAIIRGSQARMARLFAQAGYQGTIAGAPYSAWMTSYHQYAAANKAQYEAECQQAAERRRAADCANLKQAKADVWNCTKDCPDYAEARAAFDAMVDTMLAEMGC
jgi:hypothetical protein